MERLFLFILTISFPIILSFPCHSQGSSDTILYKNSYSPVVCNNHHCYLNSCWALKFNDSIILDSLPPDSIWKELYQKEDDYCTWYIYNYCEAIRYNEIIKDMGDGTLIYKHWETGKLFRGSHNHCKCLAPGNKIFTVSGYREVEQLAIGDSVATIDLGDTVFLPLIKVCKVAVEEIDHIVCIIEFTNGRSITVSAEHPTADYKDFIGSIETGDTLDGLTVASINKITYKEKFTYDILPAGNTGTYWVNGVRLGSTLFDQWSSSYLSK